MAYLWASSSITLDHTRRFAASPTTLTLIAEKAADHLRCGARYTLYADKCGNRSTNGRDRRCKQIALHAFGELLGVLRRHGPDLVFEPRLMPSTARFESLVLDPVPMWHPPRWSTGAPPLYVQCDASFLRPNEVRAGIFVDGASYAVDLSDARPPTSTAAEFLAGCLGLITGVGDRAPLTVRNDAETVVPEVAALQEGQLPQWLRYSGTALAHRIAITAITASRLRPVCVEHGLRETVQDAHQAAYYQTPRGVLGMTAQGWSRRQGIPLDWYDRRRIEVLGMEAYVDAV